MRSQDGMFAKFGVGPRFVAYSLAATALVLALQFGVFPDPRFTFGAPAVNWALGGLWGAVGAVVFVAAIVQFNRCYRRGELCTRGVYALMRHPMYGAWIVFIVPGMVIALGAWCGLALPPVMFLLFRRLSVAEERYLEERFGDAYRAYRQRVGLLWPRLRM